MSITTILLAEVGAKISGGTNRKSFSLLYSASKTVDVDEFHVKCDAKGPTVTLLYGRFNTLFGGYTSKSWTSTYKQTKHDDDAFLFYKDESPGTICKFLPIKKDKAHKAITCHASFGPTFGGGSKKKYDLQVFKKDSDAQQNDSGNFMHLNGTFKVGRAYEEEITDGSVGKKRDKTPDINSGKLIVARVEVYQVIDDELMDNWKWKPKDMACNDMKKELIEMEQPGLNVKQYNILLVGEIGSGKSSFYNTLATVFSGKVTRPAVTRASRTSVTNKVENYDLKSENGTKLKIRITDIRGFEDQRGLKEELEHLLNGKLPTGYHFTDEPGPFENNLRTNVTLNDEIHLVCLVSGNTNFDALPRTLCKHIEAIKVTINNKGLPIAVIVTKCDELCPIVSENVDHVYKCSKTRDAVKRVAEFYGEARTKVFPVVNYVSEMENDIGIDRLALQALHGMYMLVQAYLREHKATQHLSQRPIQATQKDDGRRVPEEAMESVEEQDNNNVQTSVDGHQTSEASLSNRLNSKLYRPPKNACIFDGRLIKLGPKDITDLEKNCIKPIGDGAFGKVFTSNSVSDGFGIHVAVKKIPFDKPDAHSRSIRREMITSKIMHPFILPLLAVVDLPNRLDGPVFEE